MNITNEMVEALQDSLGKEGVYVGDKTCLRAITAALRHAEPCEPVAVKALEWSAESPYHVARVLGIGGLHYSIERVDAAVTYFELKGMFVWPVRKFPTIDEAKAAAQANFESRIRSALIGGADGK